MSLLEATLKEHLKMRLPVPGHGSVFPGSPCPCGLLAASWTGWHNRSSHPPIMLPAIMIAAHQCMEQGHKKALETLGKRPLLDLDLRLGEGRGGSSGYESGRSCRRYSDRYGHF